MITPLIYATKGEHNYIKHYQQKWPGISLVDEKEIFLIFLSNLLPFLLFIFEKLLKMILYSKMFWKMRQHFEHKIDLQLQLAKYDLPILVGVCSLVCLDIGFTFNKWDISYALKIEIKWFLQMMAKIDSKEFVSNKLLLGFICSELKPCFCWRTTPGPDH